MPKTTEEEALTILKRIISDDLDDSEKSYYQDIIDGNLAEYFINPR